MKKLSLLVVFAVIMPVLLFTQVSCSVGAVNEEEGRYNYLIVGFDDASQNTDVIIIASIDAHKERLDLIQIPRDTAYFDGENCYKLNSVYPKKLLSGMSQTQALDYLSKELSGAFGLKFDGYFGLTTNNLRDIVNILGGVEVTVPESFDEELLNTLRLKRGKNVLDGDDVLRVVRHRKSYLTGDLGRMDAQKLVLAGLIKKYSESFDFKTVIGTVMELSGVISDFRMRDILNILGKSRGSFDGYTLSFSTLSGVAEKDESGVWYFVANKNANRMLLRELEIGVTGDFDSSGKFKPVGKNNLNFLYDKIGVKPKIYYNDEIFSIIFNTNT